MVDQALQVTWLRILEPEFGLTNISISKITRSCSKMCSSRHSLSIRDEGTGTTPSSILQMPYSTGMSAS